MSETLAPFSKLMRRPEAARYIREKYGQRMSPQTLARMAVDGSGPAMCKLLNGDVTYTPAALDAWAQARVLAGTFRSTAEMPGEYRRPVRRDPHPAQQENPELPAVRRRARGRLAREEETTT
jgi:hypothetical protein